MPMVSFSLIRPVHPEDRCGICLAPLRDEMAVAHPGEGQKHPVHRRCMQAWVRTNPQCPICKAGVDVLSLYVPQTWKEKMASRVMDICSHPQGRDLCAFVLTTGVLGIASMPTSSGYPIAERIGRVVFTSALIGRGTVFVQREYARVLGLYRGMSTEEYSEWMRKAPPVVCTNYIKKTERFREVRKLPLVDHALILEAVGMVTTMLLVERILQSK